MAVHTIYTYDKTGKYLETIEIDKLVPHPPRFTEIAPTIEAGKTPIFNFKNWVNVDNSKFEPSLEQLKADKIKHLRTDFNTKIENVKADNAPYEIDTWTTQNQEWTTYIANSAAPTPYVDALATARGISKTELMVKIGYKVVGIATLQGTQHGLEDRIKACTTKEELNLIIW